MVEHSSSNINQYIKDPSLVNNMRIDLLRASIMSLSLVVIFIIFILYARNQDNGLNSWVYIISGLAGLLIVLYKPGRPAQFNRMTIGVPKEYTEYEKRLETVMLHLRERWIMALVTLPYFIWLLSILASNETAIRNDFITLLLSGFFSFFVTLMLAAGVQYLQIWWSLGQVRNKQTK